MEREIKAQKTEDAESSESLRLEVLSRYQIVDLQTQAALDGLTRLAAHICQTRVALITFVDRDRQWFKSAVGSDVREVPLDVGFCPIAVRQKSNLIIPDTTADPRYASNPAVSMPGVRSYAGILLIASDGSILGTLCVIDLVPRQFSSTQIQALEMLAHQTMMQLEQMLVLRKSLQTDRALLKITPAIDATIGQEFFDTLVGSLASALEVDYAYISVLDEDKSERAKTIAMCHHGQLFDNIEYDITVTPCKEAIESKKLCCYPSRVYALFPEAEWLVRQKIETYVAIPLINSRGVVLGILGILDLKPLTNVSLAESLLGILATRTVSEIERQKNEAVTQENEIKLRFALESSQIGQFDLDLTAKPYAMRRSPKYDEIFGYSSLLTEWNYEIFLQYVHPEDRALVDEKFKKTLSDYQDWEWECRIVRLDGAIRWIWGRSSVYRDLKGIPVRLLGIAIDITDRKESEAALRESEWRFRQVVESKVFGVLFGDARGAIHYANEYILKLLGYSAEEILSGTVQWNRLTPPEFADRDATAIAQLTKEGVCQPYEKAYVSKDGRQIPVLVTAAMLEQPFGHQQEAVAFILDLTELRRIKEERDRFFSLSIDMLAIANFDGYFIHLNPSWEETLGWTQKELMAKPFMEFVHPEDKQRTLKEVEKLSQGEDTIQFENRYLTKDGSYRWLAWNSATVIENKIVYASAVWSKFYSI